MRSEANLHYKRFPFCIACIAIYIYIRGVRCALSFVCIRLFSDVAFSAGLYHIVYVLHSCSRFSNIQQLVCIRLCCRILVRGRMDHMCYVVFSRALMPPRARFYVLLYYFVYDVLILFVSIS